MNRPLVQSPGGVTLAGGGPVSATDLRRCLARAPMAVAADGGADRLLAHGVMPEAVIGDMDSLSEAARARIPAARLHPIAEQESTDFDKALRSIRAPFILATGFAGGRIDHGLAAMNALLRHAGRACILVGPKDLAFAAPPRPIALALRPGDTVSLFPLARVGGRSEGLHWPIAGLDFAPDGVIGTSNRATGRRVELAFDRPGMVVMVPRGRLDATIRALTEGGG
ncbi:thiamine diphosphokinase [Pseudogemmobacter sonorensis]|uniref:thiamine diphosphokinase n=1 Tax=Pseudogemmobacter sonorensis TaxID=2989681 RepID=UPI0036D12C89